MNGGIYRHDPPPQQGRRFVPIPDQGDQPPRFSRALFMAAVLASWPTGLEYQPQRQVPTVPIPEQGDQPPRQSRVSALLTSWYDENYPQQRRPQIAAILPAATVEEQPPFTRLPDSILAAWELDPPLPRGLKRIAPLTLIYGDEPPRYSPANFFAIIEKWRPPDPMPQQGRRDVATLTLTYGDQPPPFAPVAMRSVIDQWRASADAQQRFAQLVPIAVVVAGDDPPPRARAALNAIVQAAWIPPPLVPSWWRTFIVQPGVAVAETATQGEVRLVKPDQRDFVVTPTPKSFTVPPTYRDRIVR